MDRRRYLVLSPSGGPGPGVWPPPPREPLPPFPTTTDTQPSAPQASAWTYSPFATALPFTPPAQPDIDFYRGNVQGVRKPGLPQVGGNCSDPSFIVTWFHYQYQALGAGDLMLDAHVDAGYTHIDLHRAAWMGRMVAEGAPACTRQQALDSVAACAARIPFPVVNLAIDDGPPDKADIKSWVPDLIGAGMKIACLAWQIDQRINNPIDLCDYVAWACPYLRSLGIIPAAHWVLPGCAVYNAETAAKYGVDNRFAFQEFFVRMGGKHTLMQQNVNAPILDVRPREGGLIGELQDTLRSMVGDQCLIAAENDMQAEFNDPAHRLELYGDLKNRCLMTTTINGRHLSGTFNGFRQPDGSIL